MTSITETSLIVQIQQCKNTKNSTSSGKKPYSPYTKLGIHGCFGKNTTEQPPAPTCLKTSRLSRHVPNYHTPMMPQIHFLSISARILKRKQLTRPHSALQKTLLIGAGSSKQGQKKVVLNKNLRHAGQLSSKGTLRPVVNQMFRVIARNKDKGIINKPEPQ